MKIPPTQYTTKSEMSKNSRKSFKNSRYGDDRSHSGLRTGRSNNKSIEKIKIPKFGRKLSKRDLD
jgi:hypothetical protein